MSAVVLRCVTVGYISCKPAGRFYEARCAAPDVVIGAFPSAYEARRAILADRRARQAELHNKRPRHPVGTKPVFRGQRLIGWIAAASDGFEATSLRTGQIFGPFQTESSAQIAINVEWGRSRSKLGPLYGLAARRRAELVRLARHRNEQGREIDVRVMALAMADVLMFSRTGTDYPAMCEFARACDVRLGEDEIMLAVRRVLAVAKARGRAYRPFAARAVAGMLGVTLAEKKTLALRTIAAVDETTGRSPVVEAPRAALV
jgi:hypothetical protein